jgi:cellulose synthase/poly-beta-1,6-N-acetylglucosamine synthase-like glycosyltransferase
MEPAGPRISIVIPARNSKETIGKCLDSLADLDRDDFEAIIIDDGSTDEPAEICESWARATEKKENSEDLSATRSSRQFLRLKMIRVGQGGPSRARNRGIEAAAGELVAFTDADCIVDRHWLTELEKGFTGPDIAGVGGDQKSPDDETRIGRLIQEFFKTIGFMTGYIKTGIRMKETEHNPSCNSMYRKTILEEVGGFDETLWPSEDVELDLKITRRGYKLIFNPEAVVAHYRPKSYKDFGRMMRRYGASQWYLVKKYGFFRKLHFVPVALFVGLAIFIALLSWDARFCLVIFLPWPLMWLWFYLKTRQFGKSLTFVYLFILTMANWNWGFLQADSVIARSSGNKIE